MSVFQHLGFGSKTRDSSAKFANRFSEPKAKTQTHDTSRPKTLNTPLPATKNNFRGRGPVRPSVSKILSAFLARVHVGKNNFKLRLHRIFNHASCHKGSPLDLACASTYGKKYTEAPDFLCESCYITKAHKLPHPRGSLGSKLEKSGDGPHGAIYIDSFAWPFPGERGERVGTIIYDQRTLIAFATRTREETPARIIEEIDILCKRRGVTKLSLNFGDTQYEVQPGESDQEASPDYLRIKYICTDGAKEFMSKIMDKYCAKNGLRRMTSGPYVHEQNEAENMVKVVTQAICTLQHQFGGPNRYWTRALDHFVVVRALTPCKGLPSNYQTPYENFYQMKVNWKALTEGLFPYGCKCYWHIPREIRAHTHGVPKALVCYFMGYSRLKKGYVVQHADTGRIITGVWDVFAVPDEFPLAEARDHAARKARLVIGEQKAAAAACTLQKGADVRDEVAAWGVEVDERDIEVGGSSEKDAAPADDLVNAVSDPAPNPPMTNMPDLERIASQNLPNDIANLVRAVVQTESKASNSTCEAASGDGPRRSSRARNPSHLKLTAIANEPLGVASTTPALPSTTEGSSEAKGLLEQFAMSCATQAAKLDASNIDLSRAPATRGQMLKRPDRNIWLKAERNHLVKIGPSKLDVYEETSHPPKQRIMRGKWVYAYKERAHSQGELEASARYTAMGFTQVHGVDYDETHMPTMAQASYFAQEAHFVNSAEQMFDEVWDISGAYYLSIPEYRTYMMPPPGYAKDGVVWRLKKGMPGTKDAGHNFNRQFTKYLVNTVKLTPNPTDGALFHIRTGAEYLTVSFHVDDGQAFSNSQKLLNRVFEQIKKKFPMKRRRGINLVTGIYVTRDTNTNGHRRTRFHQKPLIEDIVQSAGTSDRKPAWTPTHVSWNMFEEKDVVRDSAKRTALDQYPYRSLLGKTAYVARCTRRDILFIVAILQRFQTNYG